jgi:hypothetical protein
MAQEVSVDDGLMGWLEEFDWGLIHSTLREGAVSAGRAFSIISARREIRSARQFHLLSAAEADVG